MTELIFIKSEVGEVLFSCEASIVPNVKEDICINGKWYLVKNRAFFCETSEDGKNRFYCNLWVG